MEPQATSQDLRVWPGLLIVALQWAAAFGLGLLMPATMVQGYGMMLGPIVGLVALFVWWGRFSRATRREKIVGITLPILVFGATAVLAHPSTQLVLYVYGLCTICLAFVVVATLVRTWPATRRTLAVAAAILIAGGSWALVRSDGVDGYMQPSLTWRFSPTPEEQLLAVGEDLDRLAPPAAAPVQEPTPAEIDIAEDAPAEVDTPQDQTADTADTAEPLDPVEAAEDDASAADGPGTDASSPWPSFRGAERDSVIRGFEIATDWQTHPPQELWRRPVGPGWGSFVTDGDLLFTQEQRGDEEVVAAYRADTGEPAWMHRDDARFWEALAGAGPRATPALAGGRLYSLGATGILNALDPDTGAKIWSRDVAADTGAPLPQWGFSSSPLVVDGKVVVHAGAPDGKAVVAYDAGTGEPVWFAPSGPMSYSSAHLATLHGVDQLLFLTNEGVTSHAPADGTVLWQHSWPASGARCVQPAFAEDGDPLLGTGFGEGLRRLDLNLADGAWTVEEQWTSLRLKPYFNDFVVHGGHAYGFDGRILAALDLTNGERVWKGGRYGHGQLVLLADQSLLLVLSDKGEIALVRADPEGFVELARMPGITGKTWNHPTLADGVFYVRNGEEMAAFRLPVATQVADAPE